MSFFDSEVVRAEMAEIHELQEEVYTNVFKFPTMSKDDQLYHVSILEKLLNKKVTPPTYSNLVPAQKSRAKKTKNGRI